MKRIVKTAIIAILFSFAFMSVTSAEEGHQHVWGEWETSYEATCGNTGYKYRYCTVEGCYEYQDAEIPAYNAHDWGAWMVTEKSTCSWKGYEERECKRCGDFQERRITSLDKNNHVWSKWYVIKKQLFLGVG